MSIDLEKTIQNMTYQRNRYKLLFECSYQWLTLLENDSNLIPYFEKHCCQKIGIYGCAEFGKMLYKELTGNSRIQVKFFMDRKAGMNRTLEGIPVFLPEELPVVPEVDMIVVTAVAAADSIAGSLLEIRPELPIVSLNTIINARVNEEWL